MSEICIITEFLNYTRERGPHGCLPQNIPDCFFDALTEEARDLTLEFNGVKVDKTKRYGRHIIDFKKSPEMESVKNELPVLATVAAVEILSYRNLVEGDGTIQKLEISGRELVQFSESYLLEVSLEAARRIEGKQYSKPTIENILRRHKEVFEELWLTVMDFSYSKNLN